MHEQPFRLRPQFRQCPCTSLIPPSDPHGLACAVPSTWNAWLPCRPSSALCPCPPAFLFQVQLQICWLPEAVPDTPVRAPSSQALLHFIFLMRHMTFIYAYISSCPLLFVSTSVQRNCILCAWYCHRLWGIHVRSAEMRPRGVGRSRRSGAGRGNHG